MKTNLVFRVRNSGKATLFRRAVTKQNDSQKEKRRTHSVSVAKYAASQDRGGVSLSTPLVNFVFYFNGDVCNDVRVITEASQQEIDTLDRKIEECELRLTVLKEERKRVIGEAFSYGRSLRRSEIEIE